MRDCTFHQYQDAYQEKCGTHGGIIEMSTLEPHPAHVGLTRVISTVAQFSPLKRQSPRYPERMSN